MLYLDCYWISCELAKISLVEKLISKELVNPYGLYDNSLLMGAPPHMAILPGKDPSRWHLMDALVSKIRLSPPVTGHQSPVIHCQLHQAPVTGPPGMDKITGHFLPVTGHPVTGHPGKDKITGHLSRVLVSGHCDGLLVTPTRHQL